MDRLGIGAASNGNHGGAALTQSAYSDLFVKARAEADERFKLARQGIGDGGKGWQAKLDAWPVYEKPKKG